ncbi:hypothetical protein [Shewanella sp. GD03713]|uniref:hypothetical protein n=1 Tax=Shewanella sp. GD03713 TaxID=2975372 RepID=UPI00244BD564|nr:hypothetical protein [Shewanella sp. GD03713]MDH1472557.1 hypothetical protein [Shewanella sp. GD03713]
MQSSILRDWANELARCLYMMRCNEIIIETAERQPDDDPDLSITARLYAFQCLDLAILQRDELIGKINRYLVDVLGKDYFLNVDTHQKWRVGLVGGEVDFTVTPDGFGTLEKFLGEKSVNPKIFIGQLDYGETSRLSEFESTELFGEFWKIEGNSEVGLALWPFEINLDGSCVCLKDLGDILICECSEK